MCSLYLPGVVFPPCAHNRSNLRIAHDQCQSCARASSDSPPLAVETQLSGSSPKPAPCEVSQLSGSLKRLHMAPKFSKPAKIVDHSHRSYTSLKSKAGSIRHAPVPNALATVITADSSKKLRKIETLPLHIKSTPQAKATTLSSSKASGAATTAEGGQKRKDQPPEYKLKRGCKKLALAVAGNPELLDDAEEAYRRDWVSAGDTSNFNVVTWIELHVAYGETKGFPDWPVFPLTPSKVHGVGALLKAGGYRSTKNYLHAIKVMHVDQGHAWTDELILAGSRFTASTLRGMGPSRQSEPIDFAAAADVDFGPDPMFLNGPIGTNCLITLGVFFLLRELELSTALRTNVRINKVNETVTMRLSASKRDPLAIGVERTWGCVCTPTSNRRACPYHMAVWQHGLLEARFGPVTDTDTIPFFPRTDGSQVDGEDVIFIIEAVAELQGQRLTINGDVKRFGKHSLRVTGAVYMSSRGLDMHKLSLLARWQSDMVLHYSRMAPLLTITDDYKKLGSKEQITTTDVKTLELKLKSMIKAALKPEVREGKSDPIAAKIKAIADEHHKNHLALKQELQDSLEAMKTTQPMRVLNQDNGVTHKCLTTFSQVGHLARAQCGWKYAFSRFLVCADDGSTPQLPCKTCYGLKEY